MSLGETYTLSLCPGEFGGIGIYISFRQAFPPPSLVIVAFHERDVLLHSFVFTWNRYTYLYSPIIFLSFTLFCYFVHDLILFWGSEIFVSQLYFLSVFFTGNPLPIPLSSYNTYKYSSHIWPVMSILCIMTHSRGVTLSRKWKVTCLRRCHIGQHPLGMLSVIITSIDNIAKKSSYRPTVFTLCWRLSWTMI